MNLMPGPLHDLPAELAGKTKAGQKLRDLVILRLAMDPAEHSLVKTVIARNVAKPDVVPKRSTELDA